MPAKFFVPNLVTFLVCLEKNLSSEWSNAPAATANANDADNISTQPHEDKALRA